MHFDQSNVATSLHRKPGSPAPAPRLEFNETAQAEPAFPGPARADLTPCVTVATAARSAAAILEWLELGGASTAADLVVSCLGGTVSESPDACAIQIHGIEGIAEDLDGVLRCWCGYVLRHLEQLNGVDPLVTYFQAFGSFRADKFHAVTLAAVKLGAGSWVDPAIPAQRITSHFYEIEMFGVLGRGDSPAGATNNWRSAAMAQLPARMEAAFAGVAA